MKKKIKQNLKKRIIAIKFKLYKFYCEKYIYQPQLQEKFDFDKVLIIAPHPDDEVIGCGGMIAKLKQENPNIDIFILYMTDGENGIPDKSEIETIKIRKREALEGLKKIQIKKENVCYLKIKDGKVKPKKKLDNNIQNLLNECDTYFVPHFLDNHPDHINSFKFLKNYLKNKKENKNIWMYEVWFPIFPNVIVDITRYINLKKEMIQEHKSQINIIDYTGNILGLNRYRAITVGKKEVKYCEAFYKCNINQFLKL